MIRCPSCGIEAHTVDTRYGPRSECSFCGLWSWDYKPLVSEGVHQTRKLGHSIFDAVWKNGEQAYPEAMAEGKKPGKFRRITRNRGYKMLSFLTGLPESRCHFGENTDLDELDMLIDEARHLTPEGIRAWWQREGADWWAEQKETA